MATNRDASASTGQLEIAIGRLRFVVIAVLVVMVAGLVLLGAELWRLNDRVDEFAAKVNGIDGPSQ
jgi:hypothetical protein